MTEQPQPAPSSVFERHFQTAIQLILVGVIGWVGLEVQSTSVKTAALVERVAALQGQVEVLQRNSLNRYTDLDAARDLQAINEQMADMRERIRELERNDRSQ